MEVLRIAMHRESWQCLAEDESPKCVADTSQILPELSKASRPAAAKMAGPWKVFDVTAVPVPDETAIGMPQASGLYVQNCLVSFCGRWRPFCAVHLALVSQAAY